MIPSIPCLPESAPFSPEQRAYLNGFFAGLFSRTSPTPGPAAEAQVTPLTILFGSQTGTAEKLARRLAKEANQRGFAASIHDLGQYSAERFASEKNLLLITSTYGDGEPPDNAKTFWEFLKTKPPPLKQVRFSVLALGDSNYPRFCQFGKEIDSRLEELGANRIFPRQDCDVEVDEPFRQWMDGALGQLGAASVPEPGLPAQETSLPAVTEPVFDRKNPYPAVLKVNRILNGLGSQKETRHFEMDLGESGLSYEPGDALGIWPSNCMELARQIMDRLEFSSDEPVSIGDGKTIGLEEALVRQYEISRISPAFLKAMAEKTSDPELLQLTAPEVNGKLTQYLWGRDLMDLLSDFPAVRFSAIEFLGLLKKLQPRLYSIASSPRFCERSVHLTVGIVRYDGRGRQRKGVCSTFLAERCSDGGTIPIFFHSNPNFRLPSDPTVPVIMIGPGTGIAPFRAFLQERMALGGAGRNWLFFGDQRAATDFLYREELELMVQKGTLHRLDTAFSRDQAEKVYVQHRMLEAAGELMDWLEAGAHLYVCGDAQRMAKDVDQALQQVIEKAKACTPEKAAEYVAKLKSQKRYQRDVY